LGDRYGQLAVTEPSFCSVIVAIANAGCDGGGAMAPHDDDVMFHRNCAAIDGDDV
jgi:hypothetical protein